MACVRPSWSFTFITAIHILLNLSKVCSNSYFEIKINSFSNDAKVDIIGQCCTGGFSVDTNQCNSSVCRTFFQICLTNFQVDIPKSPECTFGRQVTPVIGQNTFNDSFENGFENPIRIPMEFVWPGDFSLIIEAMHDVTGMHVEEGSERKLLSQLAMTDAIEASTTWTNKTHRDQNHTLEFSYRVVCKANRFGPVCAKECTPRDDYFSHYTCDSDGNKVCLDGWTGQRCVVPVCEGCEHGNCITPNQCSCQEGWKGENCNECITHPSCINGYCYSAFQCICEAGWRGIFCNFDATFCTVNNPCRNGGTCEHTDSGSGYQCNCPDGVSGSHCEIVQPDSCDCENGGTCRYVDDGVKACDCPTGFSGDRCQDEATCPCVNGGTCQMFSGAYLCLCPAGYFGPTCDNYNDCLSVDIPCQNGGTCLDGKDSYSCGCPAGFIGDYCETNICADNPCQNGGTCNGQADGMRCDCPIGYSGTHCEFVENSCLLLPCANGGICFDLENDFQCKCPLGFESKDCSVNINECASSPCKNGAACRDLVNDFECDCPLGWFGELCDDYVTTFIISTTLPSDKPAAESINVSPTNVQRNTTNNSLISNLRRDDESGHTATDLKQVLIYCFCGLLIVLIIILLCIIVYRKKRVNDDTEKGPCDIEQNNQKVYTDNFTQQKKVLPLSSISIKVCNEENDSYSKGTSKQFSTIKDYEKDIYSQKVLQENSDSLSEKISRHSYQKKIPDRRKSVEVCQPQVDSSTVQITIENQDTKETKPINISENTSVEKEKTTKAQYLATQV
ncbi:neurogenic locus protein delta-like [Anneissia japonica]|uniref:neurogenic locus protein delta-like n=1 Tax=Anneissia japonica TaxID=1529436 RepID=UPI0014257932|nr:neurogenic locus protein delta-like [Anneissia japonica]